MVHCSLATAARVKPGRVGTLTMWLSMGLATCILFAPKHPGICLECLVWEHLSDVYNAALGRPPGSCPLFLQRGTSNLFSFWVADVSRPSSRPRIQWVSRPGWGIYSGKFQISLLRRGRDGAAEWRDFKGEVGGRRHTDAGREVHE